MTDPWSDLAQARLRNRPMGTASDEYNRYLDKEILSLESALARAKQLRNLGNSLVSLPEEVLLLIIRYRRDLTLRDTKPDHPHIEYRHRPEVYQPWTSVAAVCRRLRDIVTSPQLSSNVSDLTLPPKVIEHVLVRSSSLPLTIALSHRVSGRRLASAGLLRYIKHNRSRVQSLSLHGVQAQDKLAVQVLGRLDLFNTLQHVAVHGYRATPSEEESSLTTFIIPVDLRGNPLPDWRPPPALKSLHITMTPFPWNSVVYTNLTHLTFSRMMMYVTAMEDLFINLTRGACIECITFDRVNLEFGIDVEPEDLEEYDHLDEEEVLEKLESIALSAVLDRFKVPASLRTWNAIMTTYDSLLAFMRPSTSVSYTVKTEDTRYWSHELVNFLAKHSSDPDDPAVKEAGQLPSVVAVHFSIQPSSEDTRENVFQATTQFFRHFDTDISFLTFQFGMDKGPDKLSDYLSGQFFDYYEEEEPYLDDVRELSLESMEPYTPDQWASVLNLFPSLTVLKISENILAPILPALEQVKIAASPGFELHVRHSQKYGYVASTVTVNLFLDWISMRKEKGAPLKGVYVPPALSAQMDEQYDWEEQESLGESGRGWRSLIEQPE